MSAADYAPFFGLPNGTTPTAVVPSAKYDEYVPPFYFIDSWYVDSGSTLGYLVAGDDELATTVTCHVQALVQQFEAMVAAGNIVWTIHATDPVAHDDEVIPRSVRRSPFHPHPRCRRYGRRAPIL